MNGGLGASHLSESLFGRDASVHDPDTVEFPVLLLDLAWEIGEGRLVTGVARHDLIGRRKAFRGDNQGNHDFCAPTVCPGNGRVCRSEPDRSPHPEGRPWRFSHTSRNATAIHCPVESGVSSPGSSRRVAGESPRGRGAANPPSNDPGTTHPTTQAPTRTRPIDEDD